jgi:3-hydroxyacyl-CoA dehydrogenase
MKINDVKNVCVVGAGNMGHQIAIVSFSVPVSFIWRQMER